MGGRVSVLPAHTLTETLPLSSRRSWMTRLAFRSLAEQFKFSEGLAVDSTRPQKIVSPGQKQGSIAWYSEWEERLRNILELPFDGVDSDWPPPATLARSHANKFFEILHERDIPPTNIAQSAIGGIAFTFLKDNNEVFVEFLNDGKLFAAVSRLDELDEDFPTYEFGQGEFDYDHLIEIISNVINA